MSTDITYELLMDELSTPMCSWENTSYKRVNQRHMDVLSGNGAFKSIRVKQIAQAWGRGMRGSPGTGRRHEREPGHEEEAREGARARGGGTRGSPGTRRKHEIEPGHGEVAREGARARGGTRETRARGGGSRVSPGSRRRHEREPGHE